MDTPSVKFFTASSGINIAYAVHGEGPHVFLPAWWVSHLELDWQNSDYRDFFISLGKSYTIVRYDRPGTGLSDLQRSSFELEDEVMFLTELVEHVGVDSCSLLALSCGGPVAAVYANRNPHKVNKLIFLNSFVNGMHIGTKELSQALCSLVSAYWGLGSKTILDLFDPDMCERQRKILANIHKKSASPTMASNLLNLTFNMNALTAAENLVKPVLVMHRERDKTINIEAGRKLAACIPNAQFKTIAGKSHLPWVGVESSEYLHHISSFLNGEKALPTAKYNQFVRVGDMWKIVFNQQTYHLQHALGLQDIALLLANPDQDIHVRFLVNGEVTDTAEQHSDIEVIDQQAILDYRNRLVEITELQQLALQSESHDEYAKLEDEFTFVQREIEKSLGLNGKLRKFNNEDEKARKSVSSRIRNSINKIASLDEDLADHLKQAIRTGMNCSYQGADKIKWHI